MDGASSADGRVRGVYVHGLFADPRQRQALLGSFGLAGSGLSYEADVETTLDRLAAHLAAHIDLERLLSLAR
jgi:adenosylcobyric acid synthase